MKVKDLIRELAQFDEDAEVCIACDPEMNRTGEPVVAKLKGDPTYQVVVWPNE